MVLLCDGAQRALYLYLSVALHLQRGQGWGAVSA